MSATGSRKAEFDSSRDKALAHLKASSPTARQFKFSLDFLGARTYDAQHALWQSSVEAELEEQLPEHLRISNRPRLRGIFPLKDKYLSDVECIVAVAAIHDRLVEHHDRPGILKRPDDLLKPDVRWVYAGIWTDPDEIGVYYQLEIELASRQASSNDEHLLMDAMQRVEGCFKQQCALNEQTLGATSPNQASQKSVKRRRLKRAGAPTPKRLTAKQVEAIKLHGECQGNYAEVARRMGIARKTAEQHVNAAFEKLGKHAMKPDKTQSLPTDKRGQESVTEETDKRE